MKTWSHNDANPTNIFYDEETGRVSLVDNDSVKKHEGLHPLERDMDTVFFDLRANATRAGNARRDNGSGAKVLPAEEQLARELEVYNAYMSGYLPKLDAVKGLKELMMPKAIESRFSILRCYLDGCKPTEPPPEDVQQKWFPAAFLPFT
jgi:hypothetical protein